jgi:superfamily II DNA/RNA helicase
LKYIGDIIPEEDVPKWFGNRVLIKGQTGSGKSYFIKTRMVEYAKANGLKMLLLSNRSILLEQNEAEMSGEEETIVMMNYQKIENGLISSDEDLDYYLSKFDIIISDECHYLFSDSSFNRRTDLLLELLYKNYPNKMLIFISATPEIVLEYQPDFDFSYTVKKDYSYIENIFFFRRDKTPEAIIQNLPSDEKVIYFSSDAKVAHELTGQFTNASFVCSESNSMYKYSDNRTVEEVVEKSFFSKRILATTKVLDNGINIIDSSVKHIIVDMMDLISLVQCVGRKRVMSKDDAVTLYVKDYHSGNVNYALMYIKSQLQKALQLDEIGVDEFQKVHKKRSFHDIVDNDFSINKAKLHYYQHQQNFLKGILKSKDGFKIAVANYFGIDIDATKDADNAFEKISIRKYFESIKNIKMFKEEQEEFKTIFFSLIFSPKNTNYRSRGIMSINAILEEDNLPYRITSGKESGAVNRNKRWWTVLEME